MSSRTVKRKTTEVPEAVVSNEGKGPKEKKARRVSTNASARNVASSNADAPVQSEAGVATANAASASNAEQGVSWEIVGALIQDLSHSDNTTVNAALDALCVGMNLDGKSDKIVTVGGCHALVQLVKNCLEKAAEKIPACDQVTELNELAELTTLYKSLGVIGSLMHDHDASKAGIMAIGGIEAVVKVMKTFPKCKDLQIAASYTLFSLTFFDSGKNKAVESGGLEVLLAAVNNHLDSADICYGVCWALVQIVKGSKKNIRLLITLGGATAVAKVKTKWPDDVPVHVRRLTKMIASEMMTWT
jgi:hypothetical protein